MHSSIFIHLQKHMWLFVFLLPVHCPHPVTSAVNAVDVDMKLDWTDMYQDLVNAQPRRVKILVDMKMVKQSCCLNVHFYLSCNYSMWGSNDL